MMSLFASLSSTIIARRPLSTGCSRVGMRERSDTPKRAVNQKRDCPARARSRRRSRRPSAPPAACRSPGRGPFRRSGAWSSVGLGERLEDPLTLLRRDADAGVGHLEAQHGVGAVPLLARARATSHLAPSVNLIALQTRLVSTCRRRDRVAAAPAPARRAPPSTPAPDPCRARARPSRSATSSTQLAQRRSRRRSSSSLPASIFEKSRMSLMTRAAPRPRCCTVSAYSRCSASRSAFEQQVGHADHAVERRADLVAHVGQELGLHARCLQRLVPGHDRSLVGANALDELAHVGADRRHHREQPPVRLLRLVREELEHAEQAASADDRTREGAVQVESGSDPGAGEVVLTVQVGIPLGLYRLPDTARQPFSGCKARRSAKLLEVLAHVLRLRPGAGERQSLRRLVEQPERAQVPVEVLTDRPQDQLRRIVDAPRLCDGARRRVLGGAPPAQCGCAR